MYSNHRFFTTQSLFSLTISLHFRTYLIEDFLILHSIPKHLKYGRSEILKLEKSLPYQYQGDDISLNSSEL
jgi:hypothetical protein